MDIQLLFSGIVAIATLVYSILTIILVKETRRLREVQTEPEIVVYLEPSPNAFPIIDLIVKNIGNGTAYDIRWEFDLNSPWIKERRVKIDQMRFFKGSSHFAPGQTYRTVFGVAPDILREPIPEPLFLRLTYRNSQRKEIKSDFLIDPQIFYGRTSVGESALQQIAKHLKLIEDHLKDIVSGKTRFTVDIKTNKIE